MAKVVVDLEEVIPMVRVMADQEVTVDQVILEDLMEEVLVEEAN
jgi:hypothetical protein